MIELPSFSFGRKLCTVLLILVFASALPGCCGYEHVRPFDERPASTLLTRFEREGFVFAASLPPGSEFIRRHLGYDLQDWEILPILTYLENASTGFNFEVPVRKAQFQLADGTTFEALSIDEVVDECSCSAEMTDDYNAKALVDRNLPSKGNPGSVVQGVLFFRPEGKELEDCNLSEGLLSLEVTKRSPEGGETFTAQINPGVE